MAAPPAVPSPSNVLKHEFAQERAAALGRLGRALEDALSALADLENSGGVEFSPERHSMRSALLEQASVALWQFIVQREACGLRDMRHVLRDYRVPARSRREWARCPAHSRNVRKIRRNRAASVGRAP
jgi:hypothetical protein